ncbi:DNA polymerase III subunit beta [Tissierella pigra]|uniref:Beta sliding clamp n=1 Tax=Tissierella pigra TaxID=2607614 RepID=A0A6N7XM63_9FIRM|nr:DNA polymerase III subunit beta [Tissierella pigra]MBU5428370.1 DNA polymerase III subunit beta [Tissierella pigra]MSU02626.1 DNA polymerase III subunit beta [Tissierella pigra]
MKFKINQKDLSKHINIAQKGISSRTTLQILDGILLEAYKGRLRLIGTDLEISIETYVNCEIEEEGAIVVNSKIFGDIVKKLPDAPIYIHVDNNNINIKCENSEFNIIGNSSKEYPDLPLILDHTSFELPNDLFKSAIRQTVFATTQDETRPSLTGVLIEIENKLISFVALDGYRLSLRKLPIESDVQLKIIIPGRALNELNKILEDNEEIMKIAAAPGHVVFNTGDTIVYSRLLEGQFFNYREIIRKDHKTSVTVNKREFQNSLERASLLAKEEKANLVKLNIVNEQILIKSNSEIGNVNEVINADVNGENINIAFNSRYILEGIKIIDSEEIQLNFMGSLNPCIIKPIQDENYIYLVLPVRLAQDDF